MLAVQSSELTNRPLREKSYLSSSRHLSFILRVRASAGDTEAFPIKRHGNTISPVSA